MSDAGVVARLAEMIDANAFTVHLNPLQELLQPEGNTRFAGVLDGIGMLVRTLGIPVIVKEIGAGISESAARRLLDAGVRYIDVAGAGGTSWAGIEILRSGDSPASEKFWDWGIPTSESLRQVVPLKKSFPDLRVIASGGIADGLDTAKAIGLGADLVASARPMLQKLVDGGTEALGTLIDRWQFELRSTMFLTGSKKIADLHQADIRHRNEPF
jgi:isopentenyl-diphosphate delta-isomerase